MSPPTLHTQCLRSSSASATVPVCLPCCLHKSDLLPDSSFLLPPCLQELQLQTQLVSFVGKSCRPIHLSRYTVQHHHVGCMEMVRNAFN